MADEHALPAAGSRLHGVALTAAQVAWFALAAACAIAFVAAVPAYAAQLGTICPLPDGAQCPGVQLSAVEVQALERFGIGLRAYAAYTLAIHVAASLVFFAVGGLLFWRKHHEWYCLLVSMFLVMFGAVGVSAVMIGALTAAYPRLAPLDALVTWIAFPGLGLFLTTFPDGRFVPRWSVVIPLLWIVQAVIWETAVAWPAPLFAALLLLTWGGAFGVQVYRYRRVYGTLQRQQTKWVMFGFGLGIATIVAVFGLTVLFPSLDGPGSVYALADGTWIAILFPLIPLSVGVALLRYRLWDIDPLLSRALTYGGLTIAVIALYVLIVGYFASILRIADSLAVSLIATGVVAVAFQPLREWLQRRVNRLIYGARDEPYRVLSLLGRRLESTLQPEAALRTIVDTVATALRLPHVAIALRVDGGFVVAAEAGDPGGRAAVEPSGRRASTVLPVFYAGEQVGQLLLSPRPGEDSLGAADRQLLEDLARQAGVAIHAVQLTADLRRSRERLVTAREEERRRLRRDLHDGLGPTLASVAQRIETAAVLVPRDAERSVALLNELDEQVRAAIGDIRRLVYELRPPALDQYGLVAAIREAAGRIVAPDTDVVVEAPSELPALPAAVEVAAYRIALEALTNVARHGHARRCCVRIATVAQAAGSILDERSGPWLELEILDDGTGLPDTYVAGVGLQSMRERAEELGGTCVVGRAAERGTTVLLRLPVKH